MIRAVVFDLDGVLIESEQLWDRARRDVVAQQHGGWREEATAAMQGMSPREWSRYMRDQLALDLAPERISDMVVEKLLDHYRRRLPLLPGALDAVHELGQRWPLAIASSANRVVIDEVLALAGLREMFRVTVSSEEVPHGKPAPDVYLEAARRLGRPPRVCAAVEDSTSGIRSALAAGLQVVAVPNREYPPAPAVLAGAQLVLESLTELTAGKVEQGLGGAR